MPRPAHRVRLPLVPAAGGQMRDVTNAKSCFPDVNVWFALSVADHPHHGSARAWWNQESSVAGFARVTQLGLLRLLTTAAAMGGVPLSNDGAWRVFDALLSDDCVRFFPELPALDELFRRLQLSPRLPPSNG